MPRSTALMHFLTVRRRRGPQRMEDTRRVAGRSQALDQLRGRLAVTLAAVPVGRLPAVPAIHGISGAPSSGTRLLS